MGQSIEILNKIRTQASAEYQARIPVATQENISQIGNALATYSLLYNEFCSALITKIGKTILESKLFSNRLARFKQGAIMTGQDVEEIFVEMAKAEGAYDPEGKNPLGRRAYPDVKAIYHRMNRQDKYVITIGDMDFSRVFRSEVTLDTFIKSMINSVYSGANYDEWIAMKNLIATYEGYRMVLVPEISEVGTGAETIYSVAAHDPDSGEDQTVFYYNGNSKAEANKVFAREFIKVIRKTVTDMSFPSTKFNKAGVMTWTNPEDCVLLINKDLLTEIDVEVLSKAFNMGKTDIQTEIIPMDDFGSMEGAYAILVDKDWFRVYDILSRMEPQRNADGLFTNYFYHVWQILSASTFKNAALFIPVTTLVTE